MGKKIFRLIILVLVIAGTVWYVKSDKNKSTTPSPESKQVISDKKNTEERATEKNTPEESIIGFGAHHIDKMSGTNIAPPLSPVPNNTTMVQTIAAEMQHQNSQPVYSEHVTDMTVYLYEWGIDLSDKDIMAGRVNFTVMNNGQFSHNFVVNGVRDFGKILPGETKKFANVYLSAGEFVIISDKAIDEAKGMKEALSVK
jgi:hypothetical protein